VSTGGSASTIVDVKMVFQKAVEANAPCLILCHNHPSGNCFPSGEDLKITKKLQEGAKLLDIQILDHIIVADNDYYSFADEGML
jgi:DNA repair protein RadC